MTLIVLRSIQQFTKLFNRKLLPLWALVWISLHHPLRYYNPFPPPSLSLLHWGRSTLLPLSQLPCLPPADFMHPLCSPLTFSTLWQLSQSLSSQAKSITPLFDPTDLRRTLFGALLTLGCNYQYLSPDTCCSCLFTSIPAQCVSDTGDTWGSLSLSSSSQDDLFSRKH